MARQHLTNYRVLRNAYAHSRQPNQVEQAMGNAAVIWLRDTIESYEIESAHYDADNGDYYEEEEMLDPVGV